MKLPLGVSDFLRSIAKTPRISVINRYYEEDPTNQDDQVALISRPSLKKWLTIGDGPIRCIYSQPGAFDDSLFIVTGADVYKIEKDETQTLIGTLDTTIGAVSMAATDVYLFIADGSTLHYYTETDYARGTLTAAGAIANNDVVVIGTMYYKFTTGDVDAGTPLGTSGNPWLVLVGADTEHSLSNLGYAVNNDGVAGEMYSTVLTQNEDAYRTSATATTLVIRATVADTAGNAVVTTETGANISWGAGTLAGGGGTSFTEIDVPDDDGIVSVGVIIGFCIAVVTQGQGKNGRFYWIRPAEVTIDPLDFATAERSPDPVWNVVVVGDQFWLPGNSTTEVWYPTGDGDAPFRRIDGRLFDKGVWEGTVIQVKDSVMAVGTDGTVYKIDAQPEIVSNVGISQRIREAINAQRAALPSGAGPGTMFFDFKNADHTIDGVTVTVEDVLDFDSVEHVTTHTTLLNTPSIGLTSTTASSNNTIAFFNSVRDAALAYNGGDKLLVVMTNNFTFHSSFLAWIDFEINNAANTDSLGAFIELAPTGPNGVGAQLLADPFPETELLGINHNRVAFRLDLTTGDSELSINGEPVITGSNPLTGIGTMFLNGFLDSDALNQWMIESIKFLTDTGQDLTVLSATS